MEWLWGPNLARGPQFGGSWSKKNYQTSFTHMELYKTITEVKPESGFPNVETVFTIFVTLNGCQLHNTEAFLTIEAY